MDKFVEVYDNLLPIDLQNGIEHMALKVLPWNYLNNIAVTDQKNYSPGFAHYFIQNHALVPSSKETFAPFFNNIIYHLACQRNISIEKLISGRLFLHIPSIDNSQDRIHTDLDFPHLVCLYYVTDSDGDTVLFEDDKKTEIKRITPKKGRILLFDGSIPHCSTKPTKNTRVIVNFDFLGTFFKEKTSDIYL
jgi:hypothetical protein